jgi:hypothetical protein
LRGDLLTMPSAQVEVVDGFDQLVERLLSPAA